MVFTFSIITIAFHILFFFLESVLWGKPQIHSKFGLSRSQAETVAVFTKNQGYYNLFLALGVAFGLYQYSSGKDSLLLVYTLLFAIAAGMVLLFTSPKMYRGALLQAVPPLLALTGIAMS